MNKNEQLIIAGPCALESQEHAEQTITQAQTLGVDTIRMNLWKPRTKPGFEGIGEDGLPLLRLAAEQGLRPALEVLTAQQAEQVMEAVLTHVPHATLLVWIGSRNQNHLVQRDIGRAVAGESRVQLMVKNQPWRDKDHWQGSVEHVLDGGALLAQLLLCHRGFAPWDKVTSPTRNVLDLALALELKHQLSIPLIMDPSHIGGRKEVVKQLIHQFLTEPAVDGQVIEVHPHPDQALTDAKQQLTWNELAELLQEQEV